MQGHKEPLDFLESPYRGSKRFVSPVLAARRPFLAPSVFVEELKDKWVSPQFNPDEDLSMYKKPKRRTRKARATNHNKTVETESKENTNIFPKLEFVDGTTKSSHHCEAGVSQTRKRTLLKPQSNQKCSTKDNGLFLFELGSPKTPQIPGKVLVEETPEEQIRCGRWTKRLRSSMYKK